MVIDGIQSCSLSEDMLGQLSKCNSEFNELVTAVDTYSDEPNGRNRAEIAFEAVDTMTAIATLLSQLFTEDEIDRAIVCVNAKNSVRGYLNEE